MDGDFLKFFFVIIYFTKLHYLYLSHDNTQFRVHYLHPCIRWMEIIQTKFSYRKKAQYSRTGLGTIELVPDRMSDAQTNTHLQIPS